MTPRIGSLFTGYGGLDLAVAAVTGGNPVWHTDIDRAVCKLLAHRYPDIPNHGDVAAIDWGQVQPVDILTGGFPCQDVSHAGRRKGMRAGNRTGLWSHMALAIDALRPAQVVIENVRGLLHAEATSDLEYCPWCMGNPTDICLRAHGAVLGDLADIGYDAQWCGLRASDVGAAHGRFRIFITAQPFADPTNHRHERGRQARGWGARPENTNHGIVADTYGARLQRRAAPPGPTVAGSSQPIPAGDRRAPISDRVSSDRWGRYAAAVRHWETILGRPAPAPTEYTGRGGTPQLSPVFVEWHMGLPAGYVTDVPSLSRNDKLRILGNGVVPQQGVAALRILDVMQTEAA